MADITLTAAVRANLLSLQGTSSLIDRTQGRLSTGLAISSPIDDAVKYFKSKALTDRATDLAARKDGIDQGISTLKTAVEAADTIETYLQQIKGIFESARSGTQDQRVEFTEQVEELVNQISKVVNDASYQGLNLLNSSTSKLTVFFSDKSDSKLEVDGQNLNVSALFLLNSDGSAADVEIGEVISNLGFTTTGFSAYSLSDAGVLATFNSRVNNALLHLDKTIDNLRAKAGSFGNNVAILQTRLDFTENYVNLLTEGSDKLRLADLNEEGANLLALQTRQQLGIQALSFAGQAEQAILGLFR